MNGLKHINTFADDRPITVEIGPYVCLEVYWGDRYSSPPPLYWCLVDDVHNLVEIGVDRVSGRLQSVTVTFYRGALQHRGPPQNAFGADDLVGIPGFALDLWLKQRGTYDIRKDFCDVPGRCELQLTDGGLRVDLFPHEKTWYMTKSQSLRCEFNEDHELTALCVTDLDSQALDRLHAFFDGEKL